MIKNMGKADAVIRLLVAVVIGALHFSGIISGITSAVLLIIAVIFTLTAVVGVCPLYLPFDISTRKKSKN